MKIEEMGFSVRTYNALKRSGVNTCEEIQRMDDEALFSLRYIGKATVSEIRAKLPYIPPEKIVLPVKTNADRIRAMTDEQLAAFINKIVVCHGLRNAYYCNKCPIFGAKPCDTEGIEDWLKQPAEVEP